MWERLIREEATPGLATPLNLCSVEDHGHHLQKEKAVIAKTFSLRSVANPVNVSKSECR